MTRNRMFVGLGALVMAATVACSGDREPVAPALGAGAPSASLARAESPSAAASQRALPEPIGEGTAILRTTPLASDVTVSEVIGPRGGRLEIREAGLRVEVPRGAVSVPTRFTVTALAGDMVAYEFGPDGSRFQIPLLVVQDTKGTNLDQLPNLAVVQAGYFTGPEMLDRSTRRARVAELLPTYGLKVKDDLAFHVWHFSGYIIQYGFKPRTSTGR